MDENTLTKIWTTIGLALLYITLNAWVITQAGDLLNIPVNIFSGKLSSHRVATGVFTILICAPISWYLTYIAIIFKKMKKGKIVDTTPIAFNLKIDTQKRESKIYQYFFIISFHILPVLGQIHFLLKFFTHAVPKKWEASEKISMWSIKKLWLTLNRVEMYGIDCIQSDNKTNCIAFFPFIEPLLVILLVLVTICFTIKFLFMKANN